MNISKILTCYLLLFLPIILCANTPPPDSLTDSPQATLQLRISNEAVAPQESFVLTVRSTNFGMVDSLNVSWQWDPLQLRLDSLSNFTMPPGLDNADFDFSQVPLGRLGLSWVDTDTVTAIPGFWPLFDMHFTAVGDADTITYVTFGDQPVATRVVDRAGELMTLDTISGEVAIYRPLVLCMDTLTVFQNDTICLPIRVADFDQILSLQYSQNWNSSQLEFVEFRNIDLPFLSEADFIVNQTNGSSVLSWFDDISTITTVTTLPDSHVIYEMCFIATGAIGDTADVIFSGDPLPIEIIDSSQCCDIGLIGKGAQIEILSAINIDTFIIDSVNCYRPESGRVSIQVSGGTPPYTYIWSNGDTGPLADSLGFGKVTVTITDNASNTHRLVREFNVAGNFSSPTATVLVDTLPIDCQLLPVDIQGEPVAGDSIYYFWFTNDGDVVDTLAERLNTQVLLPGLYYFNVVDSTNGCAGQDSVYVIGDVVLPIAEAGVKKRFVTCDNPTIELNATGSTPAGDSIIYIWTSDKGFADTSFSVFVSEPANYILTVVNTNTFCREIDRVEVEADTFTPQANAGENQTIKCFETDVLLSGGTDNIYGDIFYWTTTDGQLTGDTVLASQAFASAAGTYMFTVVNSLNGCVDSDFAMVVIDTVPPMAFLQDSVGLGCLSNQIDLSVQANIGAPYRYRWVPLLGGGMVVGDDMSQTVTVEGKGLYQVSVRDTTNNCRIFLRVAVVDGDDIPEILLSRDTNLNCLTNSITIQAAVQFGSGIFMYDWQASGGGTIVAGQNALNPTVSSAGTYTLIVTDLVSMCTDTAFIIVNDDENRPVADAGEDKVLSCQSLSAILGQGNTSLGSQFDYKWNVMTGGPLTSGDTLRLVSVQEAGTYQLVVTNTVSGCVETDEVTVTLDPDFFIVDAGMDRIIFCEDAPIIIGSGNTTVRNSLVFEWSTPIAGTGNIVSGEDTPFATIDEPGTYTLVVTDTVQDCALFAQVNIAADPQRPESIIAEDGFIDCKNPTFELSGLPASSMGDSISYQWEYIGSQPGGVVSGANNIIATVDAGGSYVLSVTNNNNGCVRTDTAEIVANIDAPEIILSVSSAFNCLTDTAILDASASDIGLNSEFSWQMNLDLLDPDALQTPILTAGAYVFTLTDTATGCSNTDTINVGLDTISPELVVSSFPELTCNQAIDVLDASQSGGNVSDFDFEWNEVTALISSGRNTLMPVIGRGGDLAITLTNTANGCSRTDTIQIAADTLPPDISAGMDFDVGCELGSVMLNGSINGNNITFSWTATGGGQLLSGENTLTPTVSGEGVYILTATDEDNGCEGMDVVNVGAFFNLDPAMTGPDFTVCPGDSVVLSANDPFNSSGFWTAPQGVVLSGVMDSAAVVLSELPNDVNLFIWTLNNDNCNNYDSDTLIVFKNEVPEAEDDVIELDVNPGSFTEILTDNDKLIADGWFTSVVSQPAAGQVSTDGMGEFSYTMPFPTDQDQVFEYEICNDLCPDICDTAIVTVIVPELVYDRDNLNVINAITPNGDGLNESLYFDFLDNFKDRFPDPSLVIFNRWGDVLATYDPYENNWEGRDADGNELPQGTYYYVLRLDKTSGDVIKGDVTILR